jgi:uncharacterized protein (TIGR03382 family)
VTVCPQLEPAFEATVQPGTYTVELSNLTDDSVAGCLTSWQWQITDARGALVYEGDFSWSLVITLDDPGTYDVTLTVDGVSTAGSFELVEPSGDPANADDPGSCGCTSKSGGAWLAVLAFAALMRRRTRS